MWRRSIACRRILARTYHGDEEYDGLVRGLVDSHIGGPDTWLFAYGSLIRKAEVEHVEELSGTARGWHRSFCFWIERFGGTREQPGLMMPLDEINTAFDLMHEGKSMRDTFPAKRSE